MKLCKHCNRVPQLLHKRGLCWSCYFNPEIRPKYPTSDSPFARRGRGNRGHGAMPAEPTQALPRSPGKVAVMMERAGRGECLFHPADALLDDEAVVDNTGLQPRARASFEERAAAVLAVVPFDGCLSFREIDRELGYFAPCKVHLHQVLGRLIKDGRLVLERGKWRGYRRVA